MNKSFGIDNEKIHEFAVETFKTMEPTLGRILKLAEEAGLPDIQVGPMDGRHLQVLTRATKVQKAVEIGTLGGFSGTCIARGLLPGGRLWTLEISEENAKVAKKAFEVTGVLDKVQILLGPALDHLPDLSAQGPFDLVFIDADKPNYPNYLKWAIENVRPGGLIIGDNTFAFGKIADLNAKDDKGSVAAIREYNRICGSDPRLCSTIFPTSEGLTVSVRI
jgi:caffeoyl-CoA O-methyltransferase